MQPGIDVLLRSISVCEGGNSAPIFEGYRAHLRFLACENDNFYGIQVVHIDGKNVRPGEAARCELRFLNDPDLIRESLRLRPGEKFELLDGSSLRATGETLQVLNAEQEQRGEKGPGR